MSPVCEVCGSVNLVKDGGVFVCQDCGSKYSVAEIRRQLSGVKGRPEPGESFADEQVAKAEMTFRGGEFSKTIDLCNSILVSDSDQPYALALRDLAYYNQHASDPYWETRTYDGDEDSPSALYQAGRLMGKGDYSLEDAVDFFALVLDSLVSFESSQREAKQAEYEKVKFQCSSLRMGGCYSDDSLFQQYLALQEREVDLRADIEFYLYTTKSFYLHCAEPALKKHETSSWVSKLYSKLSRDETRLMVEGTAERMYWEAHNEEKQILDSELESASKEKKEIESEIVKLKDQIEKASKDAKRAREDNAAKAKKYEEDLREQASEKLALADDLPFFKQMEKRALKKEYFDIVNSASEKANRLHLKLDTESTGKARNEINACHKQIAEKEKHLESLQKKIQESENKIESMPIGFVKRTCLGEEQA